MRSFLTGILMCCATSAGAVTFNGDFSNGLAGFDLDACGLSCGRPTDPFFDILTNGGNPYLGVTTSTSLLGVTQASASTDIQIGTGSNLLRFDAVQFPTRDDPGSRGGSPFYDALSVLVIDSASRFHFLFDIVAAGAVFNPFSNPAIGVTQTAPSDPFFDTGVAVDLRAFEGQTLSLGVYAFTESDGVMLYGGFDNFTLTSLGGSTVPLPASLPLLLGAVGLLGLARRRWAG